MAVGALSQDEFIEKIIDSVKLADIVNLDKLKENYKAAVLQIHPDRCANPKAQEATQKLNEFKDRYENGVELKDDAGKLNTNDYIVRFSGDPAALRESFDNFTRLKKMKDELLDRFLPASMKFEGDELVVDIGIRALPLTNVNLPQEHVNWLMSRVLEFTSFVQQHGYSHMGINPESVYVMPDEHWVKIVSFYHMTRLGARPKTISSAYQIWYPNQLFVEQKAIEKVDSDMTKKLAIYLLGDKSGVGIRLKKTHHKEFLDFVLSSHNSSQECFVLYREMLKKNFEKKFYPLKM